MSQSSIVLVHVIVRILSGKKKKCIDSFDIEYTLYLD